MLDVVLFRFGITAFSTSETGHVDELVIEIMPGV
jgi:hypothetical protein